MKRSFTNLAKTKRLRRATILCLTACVSATLAAPIIPSSCQAQGGRGQKPTPSQSGPAAAAPESPIQVAFTLYQLKQYAAAADAFEGAIRTATPEPRLYYYAAIANQAAGRAARAKVLFQYIAKNWSTSAEATNARAALNALGGNESPAAAAAAATTTTATAAATAAAAAPATAAAEKGAKHVKGACAFSPEEIAKQGAHAIDQSRYPNCWFESSMSALAMLPRGQRLLSNMIHYGEGDKYVVRFPGDGVEYIVSKEDADDAGITNKALWASLLECAQIKKFPNNQGAEGAYSDKSRLDVGMGCITGAKAEEIMLANASPSELTSFIGGAIRSQNPIIACTQSERTIGSLPELVFGSHAYTIISIDSAKNMVTMRNPHGAGSRRFFLPGDPQHLKFEQLDDGVFRINMELLPSYFYSVARSFI